MEQKSIKVSWDTFDEIEGMVEKIKPLTDDGSEVEISKKGLWVKGGEDYIQIIVGTSVVDD